MTVILPPDPQAWGAGGYRVSPVLIAPVEWVDCLLNYHNVKNFSRSK